MINAKIAYKYLIRAREMNDGLWINHSIYVGQAARKIASYIDGIDANLAESYGYLHDIGRMFGEMKINHIFEGYRFLLSEGYDDAARICLTHSFPVQDIKQVKGVWDSSPADYKFMENYLTSIEYTQYDELIQLCDVFGSAEGVTAMEKRLVDIVLRYGMDEYTVNRWKSLFVLKEKFEKKIGRQIEDVLGLKVVTY